MPELSIVAVIVVVAAGGYFILRPILNASSGSSNDVSRQKRRDVRLQETALECAALASLLISFPYGLLGLSSLAMVLGAALALVIIPAVARPALGFVVVVFAFTRLSPAQVVQLALVLVAFVLVRVVIRMSGLR